MGALARGLHQNGKAAGLLFCDKPRENKDAENFVFFFAGQKNFVIMNLYPYNAGHLMVVPFRHIGQIEDFETDERNEHYGNRQPGSRNN